MPLFYIDLHDGSELVRDTEGFDLPDAEAALTKMVQVMKRVAELLDTTSDHQAYQATVRDQHDRVIAQANLTLDMDVVDAF
ncbi:hypothetical protein MKK68_16625 [Methylobacterium sp. E-016]|uniref:DUF6894 family protein n=1 Tax=Methylobacterium sp. E-016 TaxID=2836556 RepID=UPI001FBB9FE2|nr:hypothetical protein [Methylobacterium sp. E-016]MCJ2077252.1 hypothetical protein [Methylobacterium sp. E-016]